MGAGRGVRLKQQRERAAAKAKAVRATPQGQREAAALAQAQREANARFKKQFPRGRRTPISNTAIKGAARAVQARAAQILGQRSLSTIASIPMTRIERARAAPKKKDPRIINRENKISLQIAAANRKFNEAKRDAQTKANRRVQTNRSALAKGAALRQRAGKGKTSKKQLQLQQSQQAAVIRQGVADKIARIEASRLSTVNSIRALLVNPSQENVFKAGQIAKGISTKKGRQRSSFAASASAARAGTVASSLFATGGQVARTTGSKTIGGVAQTITGQTSAAARFAQQQGKTTRVSTTRKSSVIGQQVSKKRTDTAFVGPKGLTQTKVTFTGQAIKKPKKVKTKTFKASTFNFGVQQAFAEESGKSLTQTQKDAQLKAAQLDIQRRFPDAVAKATGLSTTQVRNQSIQGKTVIPTSRPTVQKITNTIKSSEDKKQQIRDLGLTPTEKQITIVSNPAINVVAQNPQIPNTTFDSNIAGQTGIQTEEDKVQSLKDQGLAIGKVEPDGKVQVLRTDGKIIRVKADGVGLQNLIQLGQVATGFDVEQSIRSTESRPQPIDISGKPLVAETRDISGTSKSKEQLREETLAFRAGQSENVNLYDIAIDRRSRGEILGPGESISRGGVALEGTELQAVLRIREEQDVARIANALQAQKFQAITGAKSGVNVLAGLQAVEARGEQQIIEPQFTFGTQQGPSDVPFFEDRERIGGVDTPEKLAAIQERLDTTPRPSLQETLGFGIPTETLETKFIPREPVAKVTSGTEEKLIALGFTPTKAGIESGIIPKAEGSLQSVPNPTETFNPSVLGSINNQFGGFNILQAGNQQLLAVQSLTQKKKEAGDGGFNQQQFDFLTQDLTREDARNFSFVKEDSAVRFDIGQAISGRPTGITPGAIAGTALSGPLGIAGIASQALGQIDPKFDILQPIRQHVGDLGNTFAADIENEFIAVQNIPNIPGAVSDVATGRVGSDNTFLEFNPTPQDLIIGGLIQSGVSSAVARPIVSEPNAQGLVQAQLKDGTVLENITVGRAQSLADSGSLKTFGGGGVDQFKKQQGQLFSNLGVLAQERPGAFVGSALEFTGAAIVGAKAITGGIKLAKGGLQAARAGKSAKINRAISEELPNVDLPSNLNIKSTVSNVGESIAKTEKSGPDIISGGGFKNPLKKLFEKKPSDKVSKTVKDRMINDVLQLNINKGSKGSGLGSKKNPGGFTRGDAEKLVNSQINRRQPLNEIGVSDAEIRTSEILRRQNAGLIENQPLIVRQLEKFKVFAAQKRGTDVTEIGKTTSTKADDLAAQENFGDKLFQKNLIKALKEAEDEGTGLAATGKKPKPPSDPKTVGGLKVQYAKANQVTMKQAEEALTKSGAIKKGASNTDALGDTATKANNNIRVINDIKRGKIDLDTGRDILFKSEQKLVQVGDQAQILLTPKGKTKVIDNIFTGKLINNKLKQVPTKIVRKGDDFTRVPDTRSLDDLGKITNIEGVFGRTGKLGKGIDDLTSIGSTGRKGLQASGQVLEEVGESVVKKGGKGGGQILKKPKVKVPDEIPTLKNIRKTGGGIGKIPKALDDFKPNTLRSNLFGVINPLKFTSRVDEGLTAAQDQDFSRPLDIKQTPDQLQGQQSLELFGQPQRLRGTLRQPGFESFRSQFAPRLANQFTFDFGTPTRTRGGGRLRAGGLIVPGSAQDSGFDSRDNARRFFRVFDVGRDKQGNPTPFGTVSRGLGVQVQAAAPIFEIEDVLGRRRAKRPRQEKFFDIGF